MMFHLLLLLALVSLGLSTSSPTHQNEEPASVLEALKKLPEYIRASNRATTEQEAADILGVSVTATLAQIRSAFTSMSKVMENASDESEELEDAVLDALGNIQEALDILHEKVESEAIQSLSEEQQELFTRFEDEPESIESALSALRIDSTHTAEDVKQMRDVILAMFPAKGSPELMALDKRFRLLKKNVRNCADMILEG
jgi:gas vesicle protein